MKKILVLAMICAVLLGACATSTGPNPVSNFFCKPTDAQKMAAKIGVAVVQVALTAGATALGIKQLADLVDAQNLYTAVTNGYCATQAQWDEATNAVVAARTLSKDLKAQDPNIALLQSTKW